MKIVRKACSDAQSRYEAMAFSLKKLSSLNFDTLIRGTMSGEEVFEVGLIASNLERETFAKTELIIGINTCNPENEFELCYNFSLFLFAIQHYYYCGLYLHRCIGLLEDDPDSQSDRSKELTKLIDLCQNKAKMTTQGKDIPLTFSSKMFDNYSVFKIRITIIKSLLKNPEKILSSHSFAAKIVQHWEEFNKLIPIVLSCITTKGLIDTERALNSIFEFILSMPPILLLKKAVSFNNIHEIIEVSKGQFQNALSVPLTVTDVIDNADMFNKDKSYFRYLTLFTKVLLIESVQNSYHASSDQNIQVLYELGKSLIILTEISLLLLFDPKTTTLDKRYAEKNGKILTLYKKEIKDLEKLVAKSTTIVCLQYAYAFKLFNFEEILTKEKIQYIRDNNRQICQRTISVSTGLSIYFAKLNLQSWEKKAGLSRIYLLEVLLFQDLMEVEELGCKGDCSIYSQKSCKDIRVYFFKEEIITNLIMLLFKALSLNDIDNPSNLRILDHLMYCVILHGNFHISVIWFLKAVKEIMVLRSGISLIGHEDGEEPINTVFCRTFETYRTHLDYNIDKICDSQAALEFKIIQEKHEHIKYEQMYVPTYLGDKKLEFELLSKNGSTLLLPKTFLIDRTNMKHLPYPMGYSDSIKYLKFVLAEEICMGDQYSMVIQQHSQGQYLKGILAISKESIVSGLEVSKKFIEMFFDQENGEFVFALLKNKTVYEQLVHFHQISSEIKQDMEVNWNELPRQPTLAEDGIPWCHSSHDFKCWVAARDAVDAIKSSQHEGKEVNLDKVVEVEGGTDNREDDLNSWAPQLQQFAFVARTD